MSLLRAAGRTMLASFFVVQGVKAATKPEALVPSAEPIVEKVVPLAQRVAPASVANSIPTDPKTLVRLSGVAQVVGGLGLATGIGRRGSASLLALSMVPHVIASRPDKEGTPAEREHARSLLLRNVALLGAAIVAANDTQGKPSLSWRAARAQRQLADAADSLKSKMSKDAKKLNKQARKQAKQLKKEGRKALEGLQH